MTDKLNIYDTLAYPSALACRAVPHGLITGLYATCTLVNASDKFNVSDGVPKSLYMLSIFNFTLW